MRVGAVTVSRTFGEGVVLRVSNDEHCLSSELLCYIPAIEAEREEGTRGIK